ncbi:TRAP transporter large permease [Vacuolonema iberomarrocanum]|uniref:TRAP transporter large permease n=1 Tax=Vacuolonema iberomarrocanum TaxID=3454632 RepID=UPI0019F77671|nr:TRAP transporter large permease subunit [filamentous cyanobacterium LEGE 07170]
MDWLGPSMFVGALVLLSLGYPVAFSLGGVAIVFGLIGVALDVFNPALMMAMPQRIFGVMNNFTLLAIPYFIFMGAMLQKSGIAENLLETMGQVFGRIRGGLAIAVITVGALLAATTGVVAASVVTMGLISLPTMLRYGYNKELSVGVIAASGTLGQIIPPSIVLVVLADQLGISVGDLFVGSIVPGLLMAGVFIIHVVVISMARPDLVPSLPSELLAVKGLALLSKVVRVMIPPLLLIVLVLGSIFFGVATPTEAGAMGAVGATILALCNRQLSRQALRDVCDRTLQTTSMVMFILIGSTAFSLVFRGLRGDQFIYDTLVQLPGGQAGFLLVSMLTIFVLGFFISFFEIAFIVVPLFAPIAEQLYGFGGLVWYGVIIGANMQTSFLTPPFGFALFYLRGVAPPDITTGTIYRGVVPFILLQLVVLILIILFPLLVNYLPSLGG